MPESEVGKSPWVWMGAAICAIGGFFAITGSLMDNWPRATVLTFALLPLAGIALIGVGMWRTRLGRR